MTTVSKIWFIRKRYHPRTLLDKCKCIIKTNKTENLINDDLDLSSSDNKSDNGFDNESDNWSESESDDWYGEDENLSSFLSTIYQKWRFLNLSMTW